jgi:hypothetical protein
VIDSFASVAFPKPRRIKMNVRSLSAIALVVALLLLPLSVTAQDKKDAGGSVSVTGCLNKGASADHYTLKDEKGKETTITGDAKLLAAHANNHNVTITGTMTKEKDKDVLKASDLKMNSVCK